MFQHLKPFLADQQFNKDTEVKQSFNMCSASQAASFYNGGVIQLTWCPAITGEEIASKSDVKYVQLIAMKMVWKYIINSPTELTFLISLVKVNNLFGFPYFSFVLNQMILFQAFIK